MAEANRFVDGVKFLREGNGTRVLRRSFRLCSCGPRQISPQVRCEPTIENGYRVSNLGGRRVNIPPGYL